jgi:hypothetical protein
MSSEVALLPVFSSSALHQMLKGSQNRRGLLSNAFDGLRLAQAPSLIEWAAGLLAGLSSPIRTQASAKFDLTEGWTRP